MTKVDVTRMKKDLKRLAGNISKVATSTTRQVIQEQQVHLSFDDVEVVPYTTDTTGQIVVSGIRVNDSPFEMATALDIEMNRLQSSAIKKLNDGLKEALR